MSFDCSRFTFDPRNDFFGVVMQQGRVQLDSDWNEWMAEFGRRIQAGTLDTFGRAIVPLTTPDAFAIGLGTDSAGNVSLTIGPGRMYVDGLLAENHGYPAPPSGGWIPTAEGPVKLEPRIFKKEPALVWDGALDELNGPDGIAYDEQPYYPNADIVAPFPQTGGPYLAYLDVWRRAVTLLEDPDLVEKAVGVDTTGRIQIVWQVKWLDVSGIANVDCSSDIPAWDNLLLPPGPRLTNGVVQSSAPGPCCLTPNTGYTGLENQLYRVEIHDGGDQSSATFVWSRDNGSVATSVSGIAQGGLVLSVQSTGKDSVLRFNPNDWVEITDDWLELSGAPGEIHQIASVSDPSKTITLVTPVSSANFPVDSTGATDPTRHTRLRRWDQSGKVLESDGTTVWTDLNSSTSTGAIPVPPSGTTLILEDGITVSFDLLKDSTLFSTGDFWVFAARATDGAIEYLDSAPPAGIYHHYARLALVQLASVPFPSATSETATLQDESPKPIPFLTFGISDPSTWVPNFGVLTQANASNPANFDLEVVYNPSSAQDVSLPVTVELFQNLSLNSTSSNYAPSVINAGSNFVSVPSTYEPPTQPPAFAPVFSDTPSVLPTSGDLSLTDTSSTPVAFLTLQTTLSARWPDNFSLSAGAGSSSSKFNLEVVYAPSGGDTFATLEQFSNLSLTANSLNRVNSQFITGLGLAASLPTPAPALNFAALTDCRSFWPPASSGDGCCCTVTIGPTDLTTKITLQSILDKYQNLTTETVICLEAGTYNLPAPLKFTQAHANITLKSCQPGAAIFQAATKQAKGAASFQDGLIVLDTATNITLSGLQFNVPLVAYASTTSLYAGLATNSLPTDLQSGLESLGVRIGVRPVNCTDLTIENCTFKFANVEGKKFVLRFGAGIYAAGSLSGLTLTGNVFERGSDFLAGFLHTTSVSFQAPETISALPKFAGALLDKPIARESLLTGTGLLSHAFAQANAVVQVSQKATPQAEMHDVPLSGASGLSGLLGQKQPIDGFGFFRSADIATLAANGGQVVPANLSGVSIKDNDFGDLTAAVLILGEAQDIDFSDNEVENCRAGFWLVSPLEAGLLIFDGSDTAVLSMTLIAMSYPLPASVMGNPVTVDAAPSPTLVYAGASSFTDSLGTWLPDSQTSSSFTVSGGADNQSLATHAVSNALPDATTDQPLYSSERWGDSFTYTFNDLPPGYYSVTLKFAEMFDSPSVERLFNVLINGVTVLANYNVYASANNEMYTAVDVNFPTIPSSGGQITIQFNGVSTAQDPHAKVGAIAVSPSWGALSNLNITDDLLDFFLQVIVLGAQGYAQQTVAPLQLRMQDNEMSGVSSMGTFLLWDDSVPSGKVSSIMMTGNRFDGTTPPEVGAFGAIALICNVIRCVISGNMFLNEQMVSYPRLQGSFFGPSLAVLNTQVPVSELAIMSNVLQGAPTFLPERYTNAPAPMNTFEFLNTVIP